MQLSWYWLKGIYLHSRLPSYSEPSQDGPVLLIDFVDRIAAAVSGAVGKSYNSREKEIIEYRIITISKHLNLHIFFI